MPPWYLILAGALGLLAAGFFISRAVFKTHLTERTKSAQSAAESSPRESVPAREEAAPAAGYITVETADGRRSARWTVAVLDSAWAALPAAALLDGERLTYVGGGAEPVPSEWAVWEEREPVVLCRLDTEMREKTPRLSSWRKDIQLRWKSLEPDRSSFFLGQITPGRNGSFLYFPLPEEIRRAGIFLQDDNAVGWTFGGAHERGYLWAGMQEINLAPRIRLNELVGSVLAGSREARFARALAMEDKAPAGAKLRAFVEAFGSTPMFDVEDSPPQLRPQQVTGRMHALASELNQAGSAADVVRLLEDPILMETQSSALIKDAVLARAKMRNYESAIQELGRLEKKLSDTRGIHSAELTSFKAQLYKDWLRETIDRRGAGGLEAFEKAKLAFPNDDEIHLMGVELAIMEKNWARATEFLKMREFPAVLADRVKMLENLIQEGQKDEGVAVIRFDPGTDHIPVQAFLNGKLFQKFIIDTGATMSSIPTTAIDALGIKVDDTTKVIVVEGIGGRGLTYEVTLDSVELAGLRVYNVKAFIANLSSYEDTGLLGQNFLNNFQLDIDYKKGILRIKKR
jgi:clan AA aspartic protease (TIGR02281 family)